MSFFFIRRPIVAIVIAILTVVMGTIVMNGLPVSEFPQVVPPEVQIQATYVGADAQTLEQAVTIPIEQQITGVEDFGYMTSILSASGVSRTTVNFAVGSDADKGLFLTQMRSAQANSQLPAEVNSQGLTVSKAVNMPLLLVALNSAKATYDAEFLTNYAYVHLNDELLRLPGVGTIQVFGAGKYALRIWVKPDQLSSLGLTVPDIVQAVQSQNTVNPVGKLGGEPMPKGQKFTYTMRAQGRLTSPEQFGNIVVRESPDGAVIRVRDVARVELGAQDYGLQGRFNGKPSAVIMITQQPGSNGLAVARAVKEKMAELSGSFPDDMKYEIALDTTLAVSAGIHEIVLTLVIAIVLVVLVVYLFLQSWRATLIPVLAIPVSLIGTFAFFPLVGFSINTLTLFGLVLAIGLVVDDAIVVVEAVERHIEEGLAPADAARKAMEEISAPLVGIALVLTSVFIPTLFIPGITGRLYQQFALTITVSVLLSAFNALTLSPALAAKLLRPHGKRSPFFVKFNAALDRLTGGYVRLSAVLVRRTALVAVLLILSSGASFLVQKGLPAGYLPEEDPGYAMADVQLPPGTSMQETSKAMAVLEERLSKIKAVQGYCSVMGWSLMSGADTTYSGFLFVTLKPWDERKNLQSYKDTIGELNGAVTGVPGVTSFVFAPPAIPGVGSSGGLSLVLEDRAGKDIPYLTAQLARFLEACAKRPEIGFMAPSFEAAVPQLFVEVDREKALKQGVALNDVYSTLQAYMGGIFINYFNLFGRQWQVYVQADGDYRDDAKKLSLFSVRGRNGDTVPLSGLTHSEMRPGPEYLTHYNQHRSIQINGAAAPGYSSTQAMQALEEVFRQTMPKEMGLGYTGMSFQEQKAQKGISPNTVMALSLFFVFLILAATYESWSLPFSVLLSTPVALLGAFGALALRRGFGHQAMENNLYAQIGMVMLIGLAAKNAILIVEFAREEVQRGKSLTEAALEGARLRLRPILMTSFAFILGCLPLWLATGAGAVGRQVMGTTVIGGMMAATVLGIFLVPALFVVVEKIGGKR